MAHINKLKVNYNKEKKLKIRRIKKKAGSSEKHKEAMKKCSGVRTKKHQRRTAHKQKVTNQEKAALISEDVEMMPVGRTKLKTKNKSASMVE